MRVNGYELTDALEASEAASPVDAVEAVTARVAEALETDQVSFLIADLSGRALVRLSHGAPPGQGDRKQGAESARVVSFTDSSVADALTNQRVSATQGRGGWRVLAPVTQRGEVIGLLEVVVAGEPDDSVLELISRAAHVLAFVVIANRRHTDLFEWGQRSAPFELSAEIQRRLLPAAFTCEGGTFTLSAWLEPAATIGGDSFDYSLERDQLHLSVIDAMGHGVPGALIATLCVSSLRNTRRAGASLLDQVAAADDAVRQHSRGAFATGVVGRIDLTSGVLTLVNAGHVAPLLMRDSAVEELSLLVNLPIGLADREFRVTEMTLQPGDRLLIVTDGMLERRASALDLVGRVRDSCFLHPREAVRYLADSVLDVSGAALDDDATIFVLDWHGRHGIDRASHAGADQG